MSASAVRTRIAEPSGSRTFAYRLKTAIPGPIDAWARSTGAMLPCWSVRSASGISRLRLATKSLRVVIPASAVAGRQTRTIDEARAFVPLAIIRLPSSVRIGQVPLIEKPELNKPSSIVSQPVDASEGAPGHRRRPTLGLLEGVEDGDRDVWGGDLAHPGESCAEPVFEMGFSLGLVATEPVRGRHELGGLRSHKRPEEIRVDRAERAAQPDVEEVGEVRVADVVVVGRIRRDHAWAPHHRLGRIRAG